MIAPACGDPDLPPGSPTPADTPPDETSTPATPTLAPTPTPGPDTGTPATPGGTATPLEDADDDGYTVDEGDCDDDDASVHPGAYDIPYDDVDQDCLDGDRADVDSDGYDAESAGGDDCNDQDPYTYPGATEYRDQRDNDCNGTVDDALDVFDDDGDGYAEADGDCDDRNSDAYPGNAEVPYDGVDQDCSGSDENDLDGDGYAGGEPGSDAPDCDDSSSSVHPNAQEVPYDGIDQDCSGGDDDDLDGDGVPGGSSGDDCDDDDPGRSPELDETPYDGIDQDCSGSDLTDLDGDGHDAEQVSGDDCDDDDPTVYTGAAETPYDGIDQDCDDADLVDVDEDGHSATAAGGDDCDDANPNTYPGAPEFEDNKDNDCNGSIDDGLDTNDDDSDGYSESQGDCNDGNGAIHPGAAEVPYDGVDQDCSGTDLTDVDGDGYASTAVSAGTDCDDDDPAVNPGSSDVPYDSVDQDCSGADLVDVDGDGYASVDVSGGTDCDDADAGVNPGVKEQPYDGVDQDCSGADLVDVDGDGYASTAVSGGTDCNDADASINPGATERCEAEGSAPVDNNCDNVVDTDAVDRTTYYPDADGDSFGNPASPTPACAQPGSYVLDNTDCDDTRAAVHPGALETCDALDNDCDASVDEGVQSTFYRDADGDGYGDPKNPTAACAAPSGYVSDKTDCDDTRATVNPAGTETCNGLDDDCDASTDEGVQTTYYQDLDKDGYGNAAVTTNACSLPNGYATQAGDCRDTSDQVNPGATEICNGIDDDCDSAVDESGGTTFYRDADGDGYGNPADATKGCSAPTGYVTNALDCNDTDKNISPVASETCNGIDDDCDSTVDDGVGSTYYQDLDGDGYGNASAPKQACSPPSGYVTNNADCNDGNKSINPVSPEALNSVDDDCNGKTDDLAVNCTTLKSAFPSAGNGAYWLDTTGGSTSDAFQAFCDMSTDGRVWTVLSACKELKAKGLSTGDALYMIDPLTPLTGENRFKVFCDMTTDGGGWTLVWKHSYMESGSVSFVNSNQTIMRYHDNTKAEPCLNLHNGTNSNGNKWCNVPNKVKIGPTDMRLMASQNGTRIYDYKGKTSGGGYDLDTHWRGAYFGSTYSMLLDSCNYGNGSPPEPVGPDNSYEIIGITFDKANYGNPNGNCDTDRYAYGSAEDCRWENCLASNHTQMTFHIFVR